MSLTIFGLVLALNIASAEICRRCYGSGKVDYADSKMPDNSHGSSNSNNDVSGYDGTLTPEEYFQVEGLMQLMLQGVTEYRVCDVCKGTSQCPGPGLHRYGNIVGLLDFDAPMPSYCVRCGGLGRCPDNCIDGKVAYTRPMTESEKEVYAKRIREIYENARNRQNGNSASSGSYYNNSSSNSSSSNSTIVQTIRNKLSKLMQYFK